MIAALIALILSMFALTGTDAGLITEPAPSAYELEAQGDAAAEGRDAPELPLEAYAAYETCARVDALALDDETLGWMLESGWAGVAGDGMEALYAPGCVASA